MMLRDVYQSIKDDAITECPKCCKNTLERVLYGGLATFIKGRRNTIGQVAEKNWSALGKYKQSEIETQQKEKMEAESSPFSSLGRASKKDIMKMTTDQQKKYITEG